MAIKKKKISLFCYLLIFKRNKQQLKRCKFLNSVCERGFICVEKVYERGTFSVENGI